jgi:hypothetical protein
VTYIWKKRRDERNERQARIFMNKANLRLKAKMVQVETRAIQLRRSLFDYCNING